MTTEERDRTMKWIEIWRRAGPELERIRWEEIRRADTQRAIELLDGAYRSAVRTGRPSPGSGLTEQQRFFHRRPA